MCSILKIERCFQFLSSGQKSRAQISIFRIELILSYLVVCTGYSCGIFKNKYRTIDVWRSQFMIEVHPNMLLRIYLYVHSFSMIFCMNLKRRFQNHTVNVEKVNFKCQEFSVEGDGYKWLQLCSLYIQKLETPIQSEPLNIFWNFPENLNKIHQPQAWMHPDKKLMSNNL